MKKIALLVAALTVLASCSMNEAEAPAKNFSDITGTYEGYTDATSGVFPHYPTYNEIFAITDNGNGRVNLLFTSQVWGIYDTKDAEVVEADGVYTITGTGSTLITMPGSTKSAEAEYALTATIKNRTDATIVISMPGLMPGGTTLTFRTGEMPDALMVCGTYEGYSVAVAGPAGTTTTTDETIDIGVNADGTASVTFNSQSRWGSYEVATVAVTKQGEGYSLTGAGKVSLAGRDGSVAEYDFTMSGAVTPVVGGNHLSVQFSVPDVMGLTVDFKSGTPPAEGE
jgi:hypothetical protein